MFDRSHAPLERRGLGLQPHPWRFPAIASRPYSSRRLAYAALLVAVGLTGAYAESIPNFESLSLVALCSGVLLGLRDGVIVSSLTMLLYTLLNPYGPAPPLVMSAQVVGMALAGASGAWFASLGGPAWPAARRAAVLAAIAIVVTAAFDLVTNLATGLVFGKIRFWLIAGIPFSLWHIGFNVALFAALGTPLTAVLARYSARL